MNINCYQCSLSVLQTSMTTLLPYMDSLSKNENEIAHQHLELDVTSVMFTCGVIRVV